ncbi:transcriptional regulator [Thermococcus chitonophagus]|uniref:Transcriptional regulator n=1 Tax=Thermococcus chitonophagus TaxID=54262 RepID=A0A170SS97_9EURY|nr:Lrp/AsnC family transcriptional regulator [Thermococcus chitonophagus]ASJ16451.1 transcriptional regulator [Thermococcus chitonophagus]CUX78554.1 Transcriptional regulator, AsnC family [Thermococcus chitonophagus]
MSKLSEKDWCIIELLKKNGRISDAEIARKLGMSKSAVRWRRTNLIRRGYIFISAYLRFDKVGYSYAIVLIKLNPAAKEEEIVRFMRKLMECKRTFEVYKTLGDYDLIVGFFGDNLEELTKEIESVLRGESTVKEYKVLVGVKTLKGLEVSFYDALAGK